MPWPAKKLKRSWVEVQKIKSKWKAQKRKDSLVQKHPNILLKREDEYHEESPDSEAEGRGDEGDSSLGDGTVVESSKEEQDRGDAELQVVKKQDMKVKRVDHARPSSVQYKKGSQERRKLQITEEDDGGQKKLTLRELNALAYSRSSLHTFKSTQHRSQENRGKSNGSRSSRGSFSGRGRGQPDMRLRMNAMLEKIKRDLT